MQEYKEMIIEWVDTEYQQIPSNTDTYEEYKNIMAHIDDIVKNVYPKIKYVSNLEKEMNIVWEEIERWK